MSSVPVPGLNRLLRVLLPRGIEAMNSKPEAQASGEHRMQSPLRSAVARWSFAKAKDDSQNVRDNNAARVAGPSRICFFASSLAVNIYASSESESDSASDILKVPESRDLNWICAADDLIRQLQRVAEAAGGHRSHCRRLR
jgi:hypothetical protein